MAMLIDRRYNPFRDFEDIDRSFFGDNSLQSSRRTFVTSAMPM